MPRYSQTCSACDWSGDIFAQAFENPSCPQCGAKTERLWSGEPVAIERDEIPGGAFFENGFDTPQKFYSHSEHERALASEGVEIRAMNRGAMDKICKRWDMPTEATLESARILLSRGSQAVREKKTRWANASIPITVTEGPAFRMKQDK